MIGTNTLEINQATMIEAIQEYLDNAMPEESFKVTNVKAENGLCPGYAVTIEFEENAK